MIFDMHFHLQRAPASNGPVPAGCVVSRRVGDNLACLEFAARNGIICALYDDARAGEHQTLLTAISARSAMAYKHVELFGRSALLEGNDVLKASNDASMPVLLHLSRHDGERYACSEVRWCLDYLANTFPDLKLIVSHCGGENATEVLEWGKRHDQIYLDTSRLHETATRAQLGSAHDLLASARDAIPHTRLLYGSDSVWPAGPASSQRELDVIRHVFADDEAQDILANNGPRLLN